MEQEWNRPGTFHLSEPYDAQSGENIVANSALAAQSRFDKKTSV
jgi:hypothetical protein